MPHAKVGNQQRSRAKQLRQAMTRAEVLLWRYLKAHHIDGLAFRRQVPVRQFIADFICHAARLAVEIDGDNHDFENRQLHDRKRDEWFASQHYTVLRFTNAQVLKNLEGVIEFIRETALLRLKQLPPSLPLPHKGEGNNIVVAIRRPIGPNGTNDFSRRERNLRRESRP
ncbi:MAG TPA: endonuclease domain-containing protein [Xanthobacteraceae bacterium]|nr:endonuclease domain-containing protein [Xanthobacteraceae bacterium]